MPRSLPSHSHVRETSVKRIAKTPARAVAEENLAGYAYALVLVQFATLAFGLMAVTIIGKVGGGEGGLPAVAAGLMNMGLWVFFIPLGWIIFAMAVISSWPEEQARKIIAWTGSVLVLFIAAAIALSLL